MAFKIANIVRTWFFTNTANCDFISTRNSAKSFEEHPENTANIEVVAKFEWGCHQVQGIFIKSSLSEIPGTNETNVEAIAPNSLIRFRGMVQDIFDPEFIWGSFELCSKRTHEKKHKFGCYADTSNCVKCVRIRRYSGPHFPAFRLNTERYGESLHIQSECEKVRTRVTPNTDTFYAVRDTVVSLYLMGICGL